MNPRIRELFEKHTIPNFGPFNGRPHKNVNGEYHNPVIEDHWQTFQEAAELIVRECRPWLADDAFEEVKRHFGVLNENCY